MNGTDKSGADREPTTSNQRTESPEENGTEGGDRIEVLLVDDNEQWVELLASDLEREGQLETTIALSANEALMALNENEAIECVVADYRMPEIDGLQLLERVRSDHPNLPFILLTGMGSEEVASKAIRAGVSDYFRKDPKADQTPVLANRIRQGVEQYRLRAELEASEERYRTITEQIWDAIVVVRDGRIRFCNDRLAALTGYDRDRVSDSEFVETLVHPDDREAVVETFADIDRGTDEEPIQEARLLTEGGKVLDCEYSLRTIPFENESAIVASIRDVTARKARERNLQREREINRVVQRALVESSTRSELEAEIAGLLYEFGYELVWIGETAGSSIRPETIEGPERYVERLTLSVEEEGASDEPSVWTARSGEPQFAGDFEEMFPTQWRDLALECGFRTGAALPLRYDGVTYGVLAVYHADPHHIDEGEQALLTEVSNALGFAIHHLDVKKALSSATVVEAELKLTDTDYYLTQIAADRSIDVSEVTIVVDGTHPYNDDEVIQYVTLENVSIETFREVAAAHDAVEEVTVINADDRPRLQLSVSVTPPEMTIASFGAVVRSSTVSPGSATLRFDLPSREVLGDVMDAIETRHGSVSIRSCVDAERESEAVGIGPLIEAADLTEKQAAALRAAYHHGYFEQPRKRSAKEIADSLGVVHSTYLQHLRAAQQKVFDSIYGVKGSDGT